MIAAWQEIRLPDGIPQNPDTHSKESESASLKHHFFEININGRIYDRI